MNPRSAKGNQNTNASQAARDALSNRRNGGQPPIQPPAQGNNAMARAKQARVSYKQQGTGTKQIDPSQNATDRDHDKRSQKRQQDAQQGY